MNPWKPWTGGECPVPIGTLVDVKHRDGGLYSKTPAMGGGYADDWNHIEHPSDIIAYRFHEERK